LLLYDGQEQKRLTADETSDERARFESEQQVAELKRQLAELRQQQDKH
jgi:hypothetical protein